MPLLRIRRRSAAPWSRLSKMNRCALTIAAGPTNSSFVQVIGQAVVQAAQRMHLVVSSNRSRSSGRLPALAGARGIVGDQVRLDRLVGVEELLHVDDQVFDRP